MYNTTGKFPNSPYLIAIIILMDKKERKCGFYSKIIFGVKEVNME